MRWLIDGYNVIRQDADLHGLDAERLDRGRAALLRLVARAAQRVSRDDFTVVFDGARVGGAGPPAGRVRVLFSRPPESADDVLMRLARETGAGVVVVTSDRRVQDAVRRVGGVAVRSTAFVDAVREAGPGEADAGDDEDAEDDAPWPPRGHPRRPGRHARDEARVLDRLRRGR